MDGLWGDPDAAQQMRRARAARTMSAIQRLHAESHLPQHVLDDMSANSEGMLLLERYLAERARDGYQVGMRRTLRDGAAMDNAANLRGSLSDNDGFDA